MQPFQHPSNDSSRKTHEQKVGYPLHTKKPALNNDASSVAITRTSETMALTLKTRMSLIYDDAKNVL